MGDKWVSVRKAAKDGTLRAGDPEVRVIAERWEQFTQYLCLGLSQDLGRSVTSPRPRKETTASRVEELARTLAAAGTLETKLRVPDAIGDLGLQADLRARQTLTSVTVAAPAEGRVKGRINWLLRQLSDAPDDLRIEVAYPNTRETTGALLGRAREDIGCLRHPTDPGREPKAFIATMSRPMGQKRGKAEGSFVRETRAQTFDFYRDLVQDLKRWQPRAPKLREAEPGPAPEDPQSDPPPFTDADTRDVGDAVNPTG